MKEVIYLEPDEEITSIIDKIRAVESDGQIILVAPKSASLIQSVVNLKLLKKEAQALKKDVSLVTDDNIGRNLASQVGITVYENIDADKPLAEAVKMQPNLNETIEIDMSEKTIDPPPGVKVHYYEAAQSKVQKTNSGSDSPKTHSAASPISVDRYKAPKITRPKNPQKILKISLIVLAIFILAFSLFYYYYPSAQVDLTVKAESIEEQIKIVADTSIKQADSQNSSIPGEIVTVNSETTQEFNATGQKDVGQKSSGTVTLSNGTGNVVDVSSGTQLESNSGLYFITTSSVSVPAATASVDGEGNVIKNPGTVNVGVEAKESGDNYNIGPTSFSVINYPSISASNSDNFSGGTSEKITIVSQDDIDQAYSKLNETLKDQLKDALEEQVGQKKLSIISTAIEYNDENYSTTVGAGEEAGNFSASLKMNAKTIAFNQENYKNIVVEALGGKIPENKELVLSADDEISQGDYEIDFSKGVLTIAGTIKTKLAPKIDESELKKEIEGKKLSDSIDLLKAKQDVFSNVDIKVKPSWFGKITKRESAIKINKTYNIQ